MQSGRWKKRSKPESNASLCQMSFFGGDVAGVTGHESKCTTGKAVSEIPSTISGILGWNSTVGSQGNLLGHGRVSGGENENA